MGLIGRERRESPRNSAKGNGDGIDRCVCVVGVASHTAFDRFQPRLVLLCFLACGRLGGAPVRVGCDNSTENLQSDAAAQHPCWPFVQSQSQLLWCTDTLGSN